MECAANNAPSSRPFGKLCISVRSILPKSFLDWCIEHIADFVPLSFSPVSGAADNVTSWTGEMIDLP